MQASHHLKNRGTPTARAAAQPARALTQFISQTTAHFYSALSRTQCATISGGFIRKNDNGIRGNHASAIVGLGDEAEEPSLISQDLFDPYRQCFTFSW